MCSSTLRDWSAALLNLSKLWAKWMRYYCWKRASEGRGIFHPPPRPEPKLCGLEKARSSDASQPTTGALEQHFSRQGWRSHSGSTVSRGNRAVWQRSKRRVARDEFEQSAAQSSYRQTPPDTDAIRLHRTSPSQSNRTDKRNNRSRNACQPKNLVIASTGFCSPATLRTMTFPSPTSRCSHKSRSSM